MLVHECNCKGWSRTTLFEIRSMEIHGVRACTRVGNRTEKVSRAGGRPGWVYDKMPIRISQQWRKPKMWSVFRPRVRNVRASPGPPHFVFFLSKTLWTNFRSKTFQLSETLVFDVLSNGTCYLQHDATFCPFCRVYTHITVWPNFGYNMWSEGNKSIGF